MPKRILVVDDDPTGRLLMQSRLTKAGYEVLEAADGEMGLSVTKAQKPDLIVLDIEMPGMNGFTFVIELKKQDDIKDTPIIVLTAHQENKPIFQRKGISHYLAKPVDFDELFSKMKTILGE
jgi:CheY-like chemotaxis protein